MNCAAEVRGKLPRTTGWQAVLPGNRNATIEIASTAICPPIASTAALLRRDFPKLKITIAAANGTAGKTQRLLTIPGFIL